MPGKEPTKEEVEIQQKMLVYQLLQSQLEQLKQQMVILENRLLEIESARQAIHDLKPSSTDKDTIIPLGSGFYVQGKIEGGKILSDIGAGILSEKNNTAAVGLLEEKKDELEKLKDDTETNYNNVLKSINDMLPELQALAEKHK
jgi:prefoldin alpha subunit